VLKITTMETATDRRWIVQGRLVGPWVSELRTSWKKAHRSQDRRACIIDLNDLTFIDKSGERLLRAMCKKGAQLIANGIYTKHLLEKVRTTGKAGLVALIVCLLASLNTNIAVAVPRVQLRPVRLEMQVKQDCSLRCNLTSPWSRSTENSFNTSTEGTARRE
jgi:anti-anti-sigma regulatory factor